MFSIIRNKISDDLNEAWRVLFSGQMSEKTVKTFFLLLYDTDFLIKSVSRKSRLRRGSLCRKLVLDSPLFRWQRYEFGIRGNILNSLMRKRSETMPLHKFLFLQGLIDIVEELYHWIRHKALALYALRIPQLESHRELSSAATKVNKEFVYSSVSVRKKGETGKNWPVASVKNSLWED